MKFTWIIDLQTYYYFSDLSFVIMEVNKIIFKKEKKITNKKIN